METLVIVLTMVVVPVLIEAYLGPAIATAIVGLLTLYACWMLVRSARSQREVE